MNTIIERYNKIKLNIASVNPAQKVNIIAVSKTFTIDHINPLIELGHLHFGENKVQEATTKWSDVKKRNKNLKLHMIGKLQSNKAKDAVKLFDFIHSLDSKKLADKLINPVLIFGLISFYNFNKCFFITFPLFFYNFCD